MFEKMDLSKLEFDAGSYTLIAIIVSLLFVPLFLSKDPDIHPLALQRQSNPAPIRLPKESAVYRSLETPQGFPLKTGLALKTERSYSTRDGDIRDCWKLAIEKGKGKVLSVKGVTITEVDITQITKWIHIIGGFIRTIPEAKRVAIYLPNDIENLVVSFACHFYDLALILIPYPAEHETIEKIIDETSADFLVAAAGTLPLKGVEGIKSLKHVIYVVEEKSRQMDWTAPPGARVQTSTYHELIKGDANPHVHVPEQVDLDGPAIVTTYVPINEDKLKVVEFTHRNIIAAVAAQTTSVPPSDQLKPEDLFLPVDSLAELYVRVHVYAALAAGSTLALNSVAGLQADLEKACNKVSPTVIVASPYTLLSTQRSISGSQIELWHRMIHWFQKRTLAAGTIPKGNFLTRLNDYSRPQLGTPTSRVRLVFTAEKALTKTQALNSFDLADLRIFLGSRVIYALTSPKVAGPICQTSPFDYRIETPNPMPSIKNGVPRKCAHFGGPTGAVEVWLKDVEGYKASDKPCPRGQIWVRGASVAGKEGREKGVGIGVVGKWRADGALEFV